MEATEKQQLENHVLMERLHQRGYVFDYQFGQEAQQVVNSRCATYPYPIKPVGYKMLVKMYETPKQVGSIVIPESRKADEDVASIMAEVLAMGEQVYDPTREQFSHGGYCKIGDIIIIKPYTGVRVKVGDVEYRLISDDSVDAVVVDRDKVGTFQRGY